ncbi:MAG TPA: family 10 glycosylhydrolase [Bacilli bacterium]|nr:family 10 glycosylhydrolase [Bacilli bacterium]
MKLKRIFMALLLLLFAGSVKSSVNAGEKVLTETASDKPITYLGTDETVKIATEYVAQNTDFRAVWVSAYVADVASYKNKEQYQTEITSVLDVMSYYNLNVMIFHVRILNDALYTTALSPISKYWKVDQNWDALAWVIEECHNRGIEFHAWMNPYRVSTGAATIDMNALAKKFPAANPASDVANLLRGSSVVILNPAKQVVQNFLVNTCMEVVRNYDIDAIHFDDYFYTSGIGSQDSADYAATSKGMSLADWRRDNVSSFIQSLSMQMRAYNRQNNKIVQFGISPSGVYRDGNGVVTYNDNGDAISTGSLTRQGGHYGDSLYSDSLRWVNEEWIDYICPQSYHGFETTNSSFHGKVAWWNKVVANKKVNLYIGIGLYMTGDKYWPGPEEFYHQMLFINTQKNVKGIAIFSYKHLKAAYVDSLSPKGVQVEPIMNNCWNNKTILPTLRKYESVVLNKVDDLNIVKNGDGYTLNFAKQNEAKFYAIYRTSASELAYTNDELIATIGGASSNGYMHYQDSVDEGEYLYGICPISKNNTLGEPNSINSIDPDYKVTFKDYNGEVLAIRFVRHGEAALAPEIDFIPKGYNFSGWSLPFTNVISDMVIQAIITKVIKYYTITFLDINSELLEVKEVAAGSEIVYPQAPIVTGYTFSGWDKNITSVTQDEVITALYRINSYRVQFFDGEILLKEIDVNYGETPEYDETLIKEGHIFMGWNQVLSPIFSDTDFVAVFTSIKYTIRFVDEDQKLIDSLEIGHGEEFRLINPPTREGYTFSGWRINGKIVEDKTMVALINLDITALYAAQEVVKGCQQTNLSYISGLLMIAIVLRKKRYV